MQTKTIIASLYDNRDLSWAVPEGMVILSCKYMTRDEEEEQGLLYLDRDEMGATITYCTVAEACAAWGVNFVAANDDEAPNFSTEPLFVSRPRYINKNWLQREAREVAALSA